MNLRTKLVGALGALLAAGLLAFGIGTYNRYSAAEYRRLDDRLRSSIMSAERELHQAAGLDVGPGSTDDGRGADPSRTLGIGSYAELRDSSGAVVARLPTDTSSPAPALPTTIKTLDKPFTVAAAVGSGQWRVLASADSRFPGYTVVVANPLGDVGESLRGLVLIETVTGAVLLALLTMGSWLILRRGLRPLESMAIAAGSIHEGDMSVRVAPSDGRGEVGQLGLALNSMLDDLQVAFDAQKESEAKLRQFLADASHELRTPLTSIQGFAELFRLGVANEHVDSDVIMRRIEEESQRMRLLVDDLLLLARLDERRDVDMTEVDLAVLAADACSDAVAADPDRRITLDAPESVIVDGVQDHLRQAIANLVSNALTHTPPGTPIDVSARATGDRAELTVADRGEGLSPEALQHAFDRFWRADSSRVGPKAGLGLSIVSAIAESHGGTATVRNQPDGGSVFTLDLPLATAMSGSARPTEA
ncbi:MAG: two-component system, OmpR family, sensor kinase [Ilumatobacteraceae bacterium]|jgi:two-component system OmpR family sensor kinase